VNINKKITAFLLTGVLVLSLAGCYTEIGGTESGSSIVDENTFIDDMGNKVEIDQPYTEIITMSENLTENLFFLGAGEYIIGTSESAVFPYEASQIKKYSLDRPDLVIAAEPDLVLVEPSLSKSNPAFVSQLEGAGINVVSLYPDSADDFDIYIEKLGMLTGTTENIEPLLDQYYSELAEIESITSTIEDKETCFIEVNEKFYRTVATGSLPALALEYAGGISLAPDAVALVPDGYEADFGLEQIIANEDNIDNYITIVGMDDAGSGLTGIYEKETFENIKAIKEDNVMEIENLIINEPNFRYPVGVLTVARFLYPETLDDLYVYASDELITRETFATLSVKAMHTPIYYTYNRNNYYDYSDGDRQHVYGAFTDIKWTDEGYNWIETAAVCYYISGYTDENGDEYFLPDDLFTKDDLAQFLYVTGDYSPVENNITINDLDQCSNSTIVQTLVDNGVMTLDENGNFNPETHFTTNEIIDILTDIQEDNE
jgi:iron complex transport system substrate-binding protein